MMQAGLHGLLGVVINSPGRNNYSLSAHKAQDVDVLIQPSPRAVPGKEALATDGGAATRAGMWFNNLNIVLSVLAEPDTLSCVSHVKTSSPTADNL